ncbi:MAG: hypothetical protein ABSH51_31065 [Solirubrobacteraceae bacterium]|jgi:hypothetical protein
MLMFGNLSGSFLAGAAAAGPDGSLRARLDLDAPAQTGVRIAVAVAIASAAASILSERRVHWAVIAVFIAFMGATISGEQIAKAVNRVLGTIVGILPDPSGDLNQGLAPRDLGDPSRHSGWCAVACCPAALQSTFYADSRRVPPGASAAAQRARRLRPARRSRPPHRRRQAMRLSKTSA